MKITVFSTKGSAGKTPIATNIALDRGYAIGTNEPYHVFDGFIPKELLMTVDLNEPFPIIPDHIDMVFDLAGSISKSAHSIVSAIAQSDVVLIPIYNEVAPINSGLHTIAEVKNLNANIVIVATKLQRKGNGDRFETWTECADFLNIKRSVESQFGTQFPILPLKFSAVFNAIFEHEKSISQLMRESGLAKHHYQAVGDQFDAIYQLIDTKYAK